MTVTATETARAKLRESVIHQLGSIINEYDAAGVDRQTIAEALLVIASARGREAFGDEWPAFMDAWSRVLAELPVPLDS